MREGETDRETEKTDSEMGVFTAIKYMCEIKVQQNKKTGLIRSHKRLKYADV